MCVCESVCLTACMRRLRVCASVCMSSPVPVSGQKDKVQAETASVGRVSEWISEER